MLLDAHKLADGHHVRRSVEISNSVSGHLNGTNDSAETTQASKIYQWLCALETVNRNCPADVALSHSRSVVIAS